MDRIALLLALALVGCAPSQAQVITFTGDVVADFGPAKLVADPGGLDVTMPVGMAAPACGWEVEHVAFSHDHVTDVLYVGIDVAGIAGDADGDGDPASTSAALAATGGIDQPHFGGGECFALALDLDGDGAFDVMAGIAPGADISGFRVTEYLDQPAPGVDHGPGTELLAHFGPTLSAHVGTIASPDASAPDLEFTIVNFSQLMVSHGLGASGGPLGFEVFLGSVDDMGVGEDQVMAEQAIVVVGPCFPQPNLYENAGVGFNPGGFEVALRYHVMDGYGCCTLYSLTLAPIPIVLTGLNGQPQLLIGAFGSPSSVIAVDNGIPDLGGLAVDCKDQIYTIPFSLHPGFEIHAQVLAYPAPGNPLPFLTSNVVTWVQP